MSEGEYMCPPRSVLQSLHRRLRHIYSPLLTLRPCAFASLRYVLIGLIVVLFTPVSVVPTRGNRKPMRHMTRQLLEDKIRGGWAGQMIGVSFGAPTEFRSNGKIIEGKLPWGYKSDGEETEGQKLWSLEAVSNAIDQDDLYVEMTFADVMDRFGLDATTDQYGEAFKNSKYSLWHANAAARRLLNNGVKAAWSGHPKYNIHANDIDFQIESDFIGLMTPGLPQEAARYCDRVGRVMNYGDGLYGGMFITGMYAAAFFEDDVRKVVEQGVGCIPARSGYAQLIRDVLDWSARYPDDWKKAWQLLEEKWDKDDVCPGGALAPFNIDAKLNGGYVALGLLYGKGNFTRTIEIATRCGQDSDCNPSSAGGILGVVLGYSKIPHGWKAGIPQLADKKFAYTNYSFNDITRSTVKRALAVVEKAGGGVTETNISVPYQEPKSPKLEVWNMGAPDRLVDVKDKAWSWKGAWSEEKGRTDTLQVVGMSASGAGAEATLNFTGTSVALVGAHSQDGGLADIYLDGKKVGEMNSYIVERTTDNGLWHTYGLKPGAHMLRVVTRDDADPRSKGKKTVIYRAIVFRSG